ncbi:MAG TPA: HAMP domain-containing histidine kinase, partial [Arcobacter sp.]|nr:HAMP domain-containing histidine kinase [Arcobacter sp.]
YIYDDVTNSWIPPKLKTQKIKGLQQSSIEDNNKEFHVVDSLVLQSKYIPLYKEISFFDTDGKEIYKTSSINEKKLDISKQKTTYIKAEDYFSKIKNLKAGEIYVTDVIGAYVPSKVIGSFTKEKAKKMGVDFKPELHGYAGVENPNGKHFEGIIRFITPVYKKNKKIGYISLALDHRHIMEYTDTINPVDPQIKQNIANARDGNYLFMWDKEGRNISHPRDYFIMGFDPKTGKRVPGWLSKSVLEDFKKSKKSDLNSFLETYPTFYKQSLQQKPNLAQLKEKGEVGLDCRYLNFAPQCKGWMEITQNGGYGSFVIYWSKVWKLTTAATIPYYTGQYGSSKRGFGFVTMGANVDEFHEAANKTKENINNILDEQNKKLQNAVEHSSKKIEHLTQKIVNELTSVTFLMVILVILIAIWMSNYITSKIQKLIEGTQKFDNNNLDYRIEVTSKDEIGQLEKAFNKMASRIEQSIKIQKEKEAQVIQKTKMASMGDMLSAIIHQWKQPLSVIKTKVSGTQLHIEMEQEIKKDELVDVLDSVNRQVDYMTEITSEFKDFFKPTQKQIYTLNDVIYSTYQMLSGIYKSKGILIEIDGDKDIKIDGYPNELMQVLINILNNASDQIRQNDVPHKVININMESNETVVFIKISDSAGGISENIIDKIFDSYFTTKDSDHGTGIGLDIAVQIITKAQGKISVKNITKNVEGVDYTGAEFTIELPLS